VRSNCCHRRRCLSLPYSQTNGGRLRIVFAKANWPAPGSSQTVWAILRGFSSAQRGSASLPLTDPLYQSVKKAREAVFDLSMDLHYLRCAGGVGWAPSSQSAPETS